MHVMLLNVPAAVVVQSRRYTCRASRATADDEADSVDFSHPARRHVTVNQLQLGCRLRAIDELLCSAPAWPRHQKGSQISLRA